MVRAAPRQVAEGRRDDCNGSRLSSGRTAATRVVRAPPHPAYALDPRREAPAECFLSNGSFAFAGCVKNARFLRGFTEMEVLRELQSCGELHPKPPGRQA